MTCVSRPLFVLALSVLATAASAAPRQADAKGVEFFEAKIRPVLVTKCYSCHAATAERLKGDLLLDSRAGVLKGGASLKPSIVPGDPDKSPLIRSIRGDDDVDLMPPKGEPLTDQQVADFVAWVKMGAPDPRAEGTKSPYAIIPPETAEAKAWWSFRPVQKVTPPTAGSAAKFTHPIDQFLAAKHDEKQLTPVGPADKVALIRRATFDLTGLPPTPAEVEAFLADASANAFETLVDRLLASPAYGQRWGRHWLDVVRYADTAGESADYPIPQAYLYRNYVVDRFNADAPYDRFLTEQIAGDLLPAKDPAEKQRNTIATGFLAISRRFAVNPETVMHLTYDDTIDTLSKGVLGLTVACARCHDHKFDSITAKDYFALYGILASTKYPFPGSENTKFQKDMVPLAMSDELAARYKSYSDAVGEVNARINRLKRDQRNAGDADERAKAKAALDAASAELKKLVATAPQIPSAYAVQEDESPRDYAVMKRGEPGSPGETVRRGFLTVLGGQTLPKDYKGSGRLELAKWLTDKSNPLTARVMANRVWQFHFGQGIVKTASDFGRRGAPPSHPELLDYLAARFVDGGWSVKKLHKLIMTSAAYRRSSAADARNAERDANNDYLWRYPRQRIDAEQLRDAILFVSGDLDSSQPGPHPFPPMNRWNWTQHNPFDAVYDSKHRGVYLMQQRIKKQPFLATFDGADPNASTADRLESTTPLQALYMMNAKFVFEQSERFAARLTAEQGDLPARIGQAIAACYGRKAAADEVAAALNFVAQYQATLKSTAVPSAKHEQAALAAYLRVLLCSNEFFYID